MELTQATITTLEFKRLIFELWEHAPDTRIRFRVIGQMWMKNFVRITHITASSAMIVQEKDQLKYVGINDVTEFELESGFQAFKPHNHYTIRLS